MWKVHDSPRMEICKSKVTSRGVTSLKEDAHPTHTLYSHIPQDRAFVTAEKYKEGKFILEVSGLI
jgi:hypothetical protein